MSSSFRPVPRRIGIQILRKQLAYLSDQYRQNDLGLRLDKLLNRTEGQRLVLILADGLLEKCCTVDYEGGSVSKVDSGYDWGK